MVFALEIENQGNMTATDIAIVDYIPTGLSLNDPSWTLSSTGLARYNDNIEMLTPGQTGEVTIRMVANQYFSGMAVNRAEIADFSGENGETVEDVDSTPDDTNFNHPGETDNNKNNVTDEDGKNGGDEDDHDQAVVYGEVYDLALIKTLAAGQSSFFRPGDAVDFVVTIINQGTLTGAATRVVDYLPEGLTLDDASWTATTGAV